MGTNVHAGHRSSGTILMIGFRIDMLSAIMFLMVTFIATLIHLFSIGYMAEELQQTVEDHEVHTAHGHYERRGRFGRFFMFLSLFCFSMLNLILTDNLFQIFVSWELVGICSYLLVGFYFERTSASNAANKAFIVNRVGDAGFIIGLLIVWTFFGTLNFEDVFATVRCPSTTRTMPSIDGATRNKIIRCRPRRREDGEYGRQARQDRRLRPDLPARTPKHFGTAPTTSKPRSTTSRSHARSMAIFPYWLLTAAGLGIFLGCVGKSAQFPLQVWLPDAMEGPTPVSALIHAATMVAAGVYLVGRFYPMFTPEALLTIAYVGGVTLFVAASVAVVMTDIKKVLAYSTVSQLGYMMLGLGVGAWTAGELHLITHAFFKALLFLGSGSVIYGCHHQQDMLKMGGLYPKMKVTALTMLAGVLAIAGTPFFSGWYSKDEILAGAYGFAMDKPQHFLLFVMPLATAGITAFYMFRMWFLTFTGKPRDAHVYEHAHETPWMMTLPLILLAILSVCVAWGYPPHIPQNSGLGQYLHDHSQPKSVEIDFARIVNEHFATGGAWPGRHASRAGRRRPRAGIRHGPLLLRRPRPRRRQRPVPRRASLPDEQMVLRRSLQRPDRAARPGRRALVPQLRHDRHRRLRQSPGPLERRAGAVERPLRSRHHRWPGQSAGRRWYGVGAWLRTLQTGYIRSYILFLALAAMAIWALLVSLFGVAIGSN